MERNIKESRGISLIMLVISVIIIILAVVLGIQIFSGDSRGKEYTREEVISLLQKGVNVDNYICDKTTMITINNNEAEEYPRSTRKIKGNKMVLIFEESGIKNYYNYENDKQTAISEERKIALISSLESKSLISVEKIYFQDVIDFVNAYANEYKYIKNEKVNGFNCIKFELELEIEKGKAEIWIDKENGLVIKTNYILSDDKTSQVTSTDYKVELNCVTEEDVNVPDLKDYTIKNLE